MSSKIILDNVSFSQNPNRFREHIPLEITFTALEPISGLLEWKVIYVGSAKDQSYDQILQEFEIGPISEESTMKFTVDCPAPDFSKIPKDELICVTALIITVSYRAQEFIRVGYYVHNVLSEDFPEEDKSNAAPEMLANFIRRTILTDKPRITKFRINWGETMKEQTNNLRMPQQSPINSNSSLLGRKMRGGDNEDRGSLREQKFSTRQEKDPNSQSLMGKSQLLREEQSRNEEQL